MQQLAIWFALVSADLKPPGDCTKELHRALQARVDATCKGERMRCEVEQSCDRLRLNWYRLQECAHARYTINERCFRGGDSGHIEAMESILNGKKRCEAILAQKQCPKVCP